MHKMPDFGVYLIEVIDAFVDLALELVLLILVEFQGQTVLARSLLDKFFSDQIQTSHGCHLRDFTFF